MQTDITKLFIDLTSIGSPSGQEQKIGSFIQKIIKPLTDTLFIDTSGNIFATVKGDTRPPLLLCAHMDTVQPGADQKPVIKDGIIYSDGTHVLGADDKTAVAAILTTLKRLKTEKKPHPPLEILITVREETDAGIKDFPRSKITAKHVLLSDISRPVGTAVTAAPYVLGYSIEVMTDGCHVGLITKSTVHPLKFLELFARGMPYGRIADDTIVNIAKIHMGESYNSVPQILYFTGEIRTFNKHQYDSFPVEMKKIVKTLDKKLGTRSKLTLFPYCSGYILAKNDLNTLKKTLKKLDIKTLPIQVFSVGDFNILAEWGITPINIGSGAKEVHTTHEHVSIDALQKLEKIFYYYIHLNNLV